MKIQRPFFLPYQERWIRDHTQIKIMEKSRQIGISWATAYAAIRRALGNPTVPIWVSSQNERQAQLFLEDCKSFSRLFQTVARAYQKGALSAKNWARTRQIHFSNGNTLYSLSSNPDAQAGKRGARILDEFALHPDPERLYNIAYPGITWGGQLEIISTHRGATNFFNRLLQEIQQNGNPKNISLHRVTLSDALEQGFLSKLKQKLPSNDPRQAMDEQRYYDFIRASCASEEAFRQEYLCQPADENRIFLSYEAISDCFHTSPRWEKCTDGDIFLGVDLARDNDLSVFCLLEKLGDVFHVRQLRCLRRAHFDEQEQVLNEFLQLSSLRRGCIDQTGMGRQFVERAQKHSFRIAGVTFTAGLKETLAYGLKSTLERRRLRLPNDPALVHDLQSVRQTSGNGTHCRFEAERSGSGHADRFWALALALYAANGDPTEPSTTELFLSHSRSPHL
ncbi:MAG: terminase family protein [Puniceicoccales bacterium]|jgi:phage FluMu gp28-like protein|nr:terminase family protein [Puniceicoccales bacterium]